MIENIQSQRRIIESTYTDTCNIYSFEKQLKGSISTNVKVLKYEDIKCALSQKDLKSTEQTESQNKIEYQIKLFISPDIQITPGSHIEVKHCERLYNFIQASEPFVYPTHQEIILKRELRA